MSTGCHWWQTINDKVSQIFIIRTKEDDDMARMTLDVGIGAIGTPNDPNDPFCGHLFLHDKWRINEFHILGNKGN